jgi:hypothetical protein
VAPSRPATGSGRGGPSLMRYTSSHWPYCGYAGCSREAHQAGGSEQAAPGAKRCRGTSQPCQAAASHAAARQVLHAVQRTRTRGRRVVRSWGVDTDTYPRAGRACTHVGARPSASSSLRSCKQTRCSTERGVLPPLCNPTAGWRSPPPPRCCAAPAGPPPSTAARRPQLRRAEHTACVFPV